jgi:hypothetical protein
MREADLSTMDALKFAASLREGGNIEGALIIRAMSQV